MRRKTPCEVALWYVIPAIRKELAKRMVNECRLTQKEAARVLGLTEAAISNYLRGKRGKGIKLNQKVARRMKRVAREIAKKRHSELTIRKICVLCRLINENSKLCGLRK